MKLDSKYIGIRILQKRKENGLSQEELSEKLGISKNHLSSIERGIYIPTTKLVIELCNVLGETPDYYLIGKITKEANETLNLLKKLPQKDQTIILKLIEKYIEETAKS